MAGKFMLTKNASGHHHVDLLAGNGQVSAGSETYHSHAAALDGIASVQANAGDAPIEKDD